MYKEHEVFDTPDPASVLWRYLDFTRFVSLLDRSALHFTRAVQFDDPYEGAFSVVNQVLRPYVYEETVPAEMHSSLFQYIGSLAKANRERTFISCWHQSNHESAAMWKLYAPNYGGVAIKSTCQRLIDSLRCDDDIYLGTVSYVDYNRVYIPEKNSLAPYVFKRREFSHENEVRAVSFLWQASTEDSAGREPTANGVYYSVDREKLIEEIRVAPVAEQWFFDLVYSVVQQYGLSLTVLSSSLAAEPVW